MTALEEMWDAVDWLAIPRPVRAVAGYLDGPKSTWPQVAWNTFQGLPHLLISVLGDPRASVQDTEAQDQSPTRAVATGKQRLASGLWTVVYCNRDTLPQVLEAAVAARVTFSDAHRWPAPGLYLWVADPDGTPHLQIPGLAITPVAVQYRWAGSYDVSACFGTFPQLPPPPGASPKLRPARVVGLAADSHQGGYWLAATDGGVFTHGRAQFHGSMGGHPLAAPVCGITAAPDGRGYWLVAEDGGVFAFGSAPFSGSGP